MYNFIKEYQGKVPIYKFTPSKKNLPNLKELQRLLEDEVKKDYKNILIDLRNCSQIEPGFIQSLNNIIYNFKKNGGRIGIIIPKDLQEETLEEAYIDPSLEMFDTEYDAIYNFYN
jgi:anti-anti-sigma regulatory factor